MRVRERQNLALARSGEGAPAPDSAHFARAAGDARVAPGPPESPPLSRGEGGGRTVTTAKCSRKSASLRRSGRTTSVASLWSPALKPNFLDLCSPWGGLPRSGTGSSRRGASPVGPGHGGCSLTAAGPSARRTDLTQLTPEPRLHRPTRLVRGFFDFGKCFLRNRPN